MSHNALLPEWSRVKAVAIAWPYPSSDWEANYAQAVECYWSILKALTSEVNVWVCLHPSLDLGEMTAIAQTKGLNEGRILWLENTPYDDTWIRDYGPLSTSHAYMSLTFNGWGGKYPAEQDNSIYKIFEQHLGCSINKLPFVGEGGGLESNGHCLLVNDTCLVDDKRNPGQDHSAVERFLKQTFGVDKVEWIRNVVLTGDDTDGHIDTIARFTCIDTVVYAGRNQHHTDAQALENLHTQVSAICHRNAWKAIELPSPQVHSTVDGRVLPATYANFLMVNDTVFAPVYGLPSDAEALACLQLACPQHVIHPVRCEALLEQHGSLHCATMQIAELH